MVRLMYMGHSQEIPCMQAVLKLVWGHIAHCIMIWLRNQAVHTKAVSGAVAIHSEPVLDYLTVTMDNRTCHALLFML